MLVLVVSEDKAASRQKCRVSEERAVSLRMLDLSPIKLAAVNNAPPLGTQAIGPSKRGHSASLRDAVCSTLGSFVPDQLSKQLGYATVR